MKRIFTQILPKPVTWVGFLVLPIASLLYFTLTRYTDQFISTQGIDYYAIQDNVLASLYISGTISEWFTRFMDFAFWGVLATIGLLIWWGVSVARVSVQNHATEATFANFQVPKESWHGNFILVAVIKVALVFVIIYSVFALIAQALPKMAVAVARCVQELSATHIKDVALAALLMILFQLLIAVSVKLTKAVHAD